ncbi:MAG: iron ABC transporter permease [archaeon]|nr:iron ABC transporter permease [archaeon]
MESKIDESNSAQEKGFALSDLLQNYTKKRKKKVISLLLFVVILFIVSGYALGLGAYEISFLDTYGAIWQYLTHMSDGFNTLDLRVIWQDRVPRLLVALIAGGALATTGAAMQSMLKNPLADSYTTGISSGASFGATIAIVLGIAIGGSAGIVVNAFIFSLIPAAVILFLSLAKRASPSTMILAGIAVMYIFNALTSYVMLTADENAMASAYEWTIGTLNKASWTTLPVMFAVSLVGCGIIVYMSRYLNAMNSGDDFATTLGVNVNRIRIILLTIISVVAAAIVSFTGVIGFVGLVGPHMARMFIGSDNKLLIPASILTGATVMVVCDVIAKLFTASPLPIGIITAIIGGPVFLLLIIRQRKEVW